MDKSQLKLYNSLTNKIEPFIPKGNMVKWFTSGPILNGEPDSDLAKTLIFHDILRRVITDYFGYKVYYMMNITDINDDIIKKARQEYLFDQYKNTDHTLEEIILDIEKACNKYCEKNNYCESLKKAQESLKNVKNDDDDDDNFSITDLLNECKDVLCVWLESTRECEINNNDYYLKLARKYEDEFFEYMDTLHVKRPDKIVRSSDCIKEIIKFIKKIIKYGYAYECQGSIYFDTTKYNESSFSSQKVTTTTNKNLVSYKEKKNEKDFELWIFSKELSWKFHLGCGRPSNYINCSFLMHKKMFNFLDIRSSNCSLDHEMDLAKIYFKKNKWIKYFICSGPTEEFLKNLPLKVFLEYHCPEDIRLAFLTTNWTNLSGINCLYDSDCFNTAMYFQCFISMFKDDIKDLPHSDNFEKNDDVKKLREKFMEIQSNVHESLCDNINTYNVLNNIYGLYKHCVDYIKKNIQVDKCLLNDILTYMEYILKIFGVTFKDYKFL